ncbi:xanthine dehydrogenase family protein subunit M [Rhodoplanes sp. TEM]|uniref:Xanthine dehydrogenase family protein subunit M n=1 Tax=Rhodoplanes tepidamans TaxID=200616 RepID=A0ABT5J611_RHOTP|nr:MULTISPECIES: xanthine dehydrogenase family protein subunit M [Rhodoplanes]MDC7784953.1 xanthine dehydrogenase family protein subunit M [Rhodoplanes tepidamans]MDC7983951.1 xanthine dehydrogenase family protein subunit M [Rhodoplanes sp. TEM]MDQ0353818.1 carbon-monoxide dehydrogenase medium subunit [Rhodoplanes tepidamans]
MHPFAYFEPKTLDETIALLSQHGRAADLMAGGTDLLVEIKEHIRRPAAVINLKTIPGLAELACDAATGLRIGALVTVRTIETSPAVQRLYPALAGAAREIGSIQIRNRATVVGNVCRASPSADTLPPLIAFGAHVEMVGPAGTRSLPLEAFFTGPGKTALGADEVVTAIVLPPPAAQAGSDYIKHGRRRAMELATVGVAVSLRRDGDVCRDLRIVLGAVAPTPIRARAAEALLEGVAPDEATVAAAGRAARDEARPISNVRASADYRRAMVAVLTRRAVAAAWERTGREIQP